MKAIAIGLKTVVTALAASLFSVTAFAQACPDKVVKLIVPFAPGTTDQQARALAQGMEKALGATIVIETKGGAGGSIGTMAVARADECIGMMNDLSILTSWTGSRSR